MGKANSESFEARKVLGEGEIEISERKYNMIIGAVLAWGFLLNFLMIKLFEKQIMTVWYNVNPIWVLLGYVVLIIIGVVLLESKSARTSFIGYHFICVPMGLVICLAVHDIPPSIVASAVMMTATITLIMMIMAMLFPTFFLKLGRVLGFSVFLLIAGEMVSLLIFRSYSMAFTWAGAGVFSMYIGYDWARANTVARTANNAVDLAAELYIDIINLLLRILEIMSKEKNKK